jgi:hypothetical protein
MALMRTRTTRPGRLENRPSHVPCEVCGQYIAGAPRGRLPHTHRACGRFRDDLARIGRSLAAALDGLHEADARAKVWALWTDCKAEVDHGRQTH